MQRFLGYIVTGSNLWEIRASVQKSDGKVLDYLGIEKYVAWPLDLDDDESVRLWDEKYGCTDGNIQGPSLSLDYIARYIAHCEKLSERAIVWAVGVEGNASSSDGILEYDFLGYDCVSTVNVTTSYIFCDGIQKEEAVGLGLEFTDSGLFTSEDAAVRYGRWRRAHIERGEGWEDCGEEVAIGFGLVKQKALCGLKLRSGDARR